MIILPRFRRLFVSESFAKDFACLCDNDECLGVDGEHLAAKSYRLGSFTYCDDNRLVSACVCALGRVGCNAVANVLHYVLIDLIGLGCDDGKCLAHVNGIDDIVKDEYLGKQTDQREQTGLCGEADMAVFKVHKCRRSDDNICAQERCGNVKSGILLQDKSQNVRTTRGCLALEEDCRADTHEKHGIDKLKHRLI